MTDDVGQTYDEAVALKKSVVDVSVPGDYPRWFHSVVDEAVSVQTFLNAPPKQGPGEACVTNRPDGKVDVHWWVARAL